MTELHKELKQTKQDKRDSRPIKSMSTKAILWFLIRRHLDDIFIIILCLALGYIIGSKL